MLLLTMSVVGVTSLLPATASPANEAQRSIEPIAVAIILVTGRGRREAELESILNIRFFLLLLTYDP